MEFQDPGKNDDTVGLSKRRLSSILKVSQKSARLSESEHPVHTVECAKPVEKRTSRRVSFAPANDVLLFLKDVKSASPVRSPLQELITATAATTNGVQTSISEDGIQPLMGMETLLNSPLHASHQRDRVRTNIVENFEEKTMVFSTEDAFMDMTQSHTINIDKDSELAVDIALHDSDALSSSRGRRVMLTADNRSVDMNPCKMVNMMSGSESLDSRSTGLSLEKETLFSSVPCLDLGFENFLASLSKSGGPLVNPARASCQTKTCPLRPVKDVDKENMVPICTSIVASTSKRIGESSSVSALCPEADVSKDITEAPTGHTLGFADDDEFFKCLFPTQDMYCQSDQRASQTVESKELQRSEMLGSSDPKGMDTSLKPSLKTEKVKFVAEDDRTERTVRFTATDAAMEVTQSHTVGIVTDFDKQPPQNIDSLPTCGERTVRFTATDAAMEVTQSHTVGIVTDFDKQPPQNIDSLPPCGERTVRFTATDAAMEVTQSHTVGIDTPLVQTQRQRVDVFLPTGKNTLRFGANDTAAGVARRNTIDPATNRGLASHQRLDFVPTCGEKTVEFTASDAAMDVTQNHTDNIAAAFVPQSHQQENVFHTSAEKVRLITDACHTATNLQLMSRRNAEKPIGCTAGDATVDVLAVTVAADAFEPQSSQNTELLPCVEEPAGLSSTDAGMDATQTHTVTTASNPALDSVNLHRDPSIIPTHGNTGLLPSVKTTDDGLTKNSFSSVHSLDPGFNNCPSGTSGPNPVVTKATAAPFPHEGVDANDYLERGEKEAPCFISGTTEKPQNGAATGCLEGDGRLPSADVETSSALAQTCTNDLPRRLSLGQESYCNSDHFRETETNLQQRNEGPVLTEGLEIPNCPGSLDSNEEERGKQPKMTKESNPASAMMESSPGADHPDDESQPQNSRRRSLANLKSKIRRLSHLINAPTDVDVMASRTTPLPQLNHDLEEGSTHRNGPLPVAEPDTEVGLVNGEVGTQAWRLNEGEQASTPFYLKTKQLMSRLSVGGFKPRLPQRSKPDEPKKETSVGEHTGVASQPANFDNDTSDIYDEELGSCEDMSETLDATSPRKVCVKVDEPVEDCAFEEGSVSAAHGQKRHLPEDVSNMEHEKRAKTSPETSADPADRVHSEMELQSRVLECDDHVTTVTALTTQTSDLSNSSHTGSIRCEATFESTFKQSLFESQLEDYASDIQKKFDDGTVSVSEFFKLFNIDFVIHNPRQSVLHDRLLSDTDWTPMDILKDRHINRPKQRVYETDVLSLTEKVEGLKVRMRDLDKPLRLVNRSLWEEMRTLSEKELKSFGAKLKERNYFFRKTSKTHSHEMKEVLYSNLVQANLKEQQILRRTIEKADDMIKSLDDCIHGVETELAAVERGSDGKPGLKSCLEELKKVSESLADNERQVSDLEEQKKKSSIHLNRLKAETNNLENYITMLHTVNEWKFGQKKDNSTVYTFLHDTMHLQVVYERSNGKNTDDGPEQKIADITFRFLLNYEKANCSAQLVHKLLSQYIEEESAWGEKYPTSRHVPKLLHDVGLVVSRCRLLGEELHLLQMWGGLRLDILDISSVDTRVHILFSSLKKCAKFEVDFSISLINELCVIQLLSFKNRIGSTTIQQVEEVVASFDPGRKLLTKIVKRIHENLLC